MDTVSQSNKSLSDKRAKIRSAKLYYESKITCLTNRRLHPDLIFLACKDAPVERGDCSSNWQRNRYIKKCLKFYQKKLKELLKEERKLDGKSSFFNF